MTPLPNRQAITIALCVLISACGERNNDSLPPLTEAVAYSIVGERMPQIETCLRRSRAFFLDFHIYRGSNQYPVFDVFTANVYWPVKNLSEFDAGIYSELDPPVQWQKGDMRSPLYLVGPKGDAVRAKLSERLTKAAPRRHACVRRVLQDALRRYRLDPPQQFRLRFIAEFGNAYMGLED